MPTPAPARSLSVTVDFIGPHLVDCVVTAQRAGCLIAGECNCFEIATGWRRPDEDSPSSRHVVFRGTFVGTVVR